MADDFNEDDLLTQVVPTRPEHAQSAPHREFKPWHKPRKQWVRRHQWFTKTEALIRDTHFQIDNRVFRYLSMPGEDLLDIRILQDACAAAGVELRFTGLNHVKQGSPDDLQLNLSESAVRGLPAIHAGSRILREKIQLIAEPRSLAYAEIRASGPFNAINIDLCDYVALREQHQGARTIIDALAEIIRLQLAKANYPWLLFLTTRVDPGRVDTNNLQAFIQAVRDNIDESNAFETKASELLALEASDLIAALDSPNALAPDKFKDLFCLGFGKWLLSYIRRAQPPCKFRMLESCYYSIHNGRPDMLSLAFRCDIVRTPPTDRYGLATSVTDKASHDQEIDMAMLLVEETGRITNLDALLAQQPDLLDEMILESESLLRSANYPVDNPETGYRAWLMRAKATAET
jgi:hypothetical protein